jgi:hypothetical protein
MSRMKHLIPLLIVSVCGCQTMSHMTEPKSAPHVMYPADKIEWKPAPPSLRPGAQIAVLEGDPAKSGYFCMRGRMPANYRIDPHWHPNFERLTIISGTLYMGTGETFDESKATPLTAGSYSSMPPGMRHFAFTKEPTVLQITTNGPWGITYVNPADDPRNNAKK